MTWGTQITLGHFQIQMWTAGLVLVTGGWRVSKMTDSTRRPRDRFFGLVAGLCWGAAVAWVQLRLTWELRGVAGFVRPSYALASYSFPPAHWAQFALPEVFIGRSGAAAAAYWYRHRTIGGEACAYAGIVPAILACVGRGERTAVWRSGVVATDRAIVAGTGDHAGVVARRLLYGFATARSWLVSRPARYTLLTSLGLALLAGRGLDRSVAPRRFWGGMAVAILGGVAAWSWSLHWAHGANFRAYVGPTLSTRFTAAGLTWALGLAAIIAWRRNRLGAWAPLLVAVLELAVLFFVGPIKWGRPMRLPEESPVLRRLAALTDVGLVAGRLFNLPLDAGQTTAFPYLGIVPPPPNYLLEQATLPPGENDGTDRLWQRRFGVTHGVWGSKDSVLGTEVLAELDDPALDQALASVPYSQQSGLGPWKLVRNRDAFPPAWVARNVNEAKNWGAIFVALSRSEERDDVWFLPEDLPPPLPGEGARMASVLGWDGRSAIVEHDGWCILIMRRTFYPGWVYRVDGGPEQPVLKANGGLQAAVVAGSGTSRVTLRYRPTGLTLAATVSLAALSAIFLVLCADGWKALKRSIPSSARSITS